MDRRKSRQRTVAGLDEDWDTFTPAERVYGSFESLGFQVIDIVDGVIYADRTLLPGFTGEAGDLVVHFMYYGTIFKAELQAHRMDDEFRVVEASVKSCKLSPNARRWLPVLLKRPAISLGNYIAVADELEAAYGTINASGLNIADFTREIVPAILNRYSTGNNPPLRLSASI